MGNRCFVLAASAESHAYIEKGVLICIRSLRKTNPGVPIVVLHSGFSDRQKAMFDSVIFLQVPPLGFVRSDAFKAGRPDVTDATFFHLSIARLIEFDIAIYLDGDTVVLDNLQELFDLDVPFAARVQDEYPLVDQFENGHNILASEGITSGRALNAGVMRYDLHFWRSLNLEKEAQVLGHRYGWNVFRFVDQSLLNLIVQRANVLTPISKLYNFSRWPDMLRLEHQVVTNHLGLRAPAVAEGVAKVVHWTGPIKPWDREALSLNGSPDPFCLECYQQFQVK